jgi:hypothetical protein
MERSIEQYKLGYKQMVSKLKKNMKKMEKFLLTECIYVPQEGIDNPESKSYLTALHEVDQQQTDTTACY